MTEAQRQIIQRLDQILAASGGGPGGAAWGGITGTLSAQTDLQTALNAKQTTAYLVYVALLTQSSGDAPVAVVLQNTLGGSVVWTYDTTGSYLGTLTSAFAVDKTAVIISNSVTNSGRYVAAKWTSTDTVLVQTNREAIGPEDGVLILTPIEIRVYP